MNSLDRRIVGLASGVPQKVFLLRISLLIAVVTGAAFSRPADAFYLALIFSPSAPTEFQPAQVTLRVGQCDFLTILSAQDRIVTAVDQTVRVQVNGFTNRVLGDICNFPPATVSMDLVPLAAGSYTVEIFRRSTLGPPPMSI